MSEQDKSVDVEVVAPGDDAQAPAVADDVLPDTLHLMPVPNRPFFPLLRYCIPSSTHSPGTTTCWLIACLKQDPYQT